MKFSITYLGLSVRIKELNAYFRRDGEFQKPLLRLIAIGQPN